MATYLSFNGDVYDLVPWTGRHIALLTPPDMNIDREAAATLVKALDEAWEYYASITGREPNLFYNYEGLGTVAIVDSTCGAGCGFLGSTGIEILRPYFKVGYDELVQTGRFDQIPFYELGRNFWFYGNQLGAIDAFVTGFAVVNRYQSMDAAGVEGTSYGVGDFEVFRHAILTDMAHRHLSDETISGIGGLTTSPPANAFGLGAADVAASLFYRIQEDFGSDAYVTFWRSMGTLPAASTPEQAIDNFLAAARQATEVDYGALFKDGWSLLVGGMEGDRLRIDSGRQLPKAAFGFDGDDRIRGAGDGEHLFGGAGDDSLNGRGGNDVIVAATGDDRLKGGKGDDWLGGGEGDDTIEGGRGEDRMLGGDGADAFVFPERGARAEVDTIVDLEVGTDRLVLGCGVRVSSVRERDVDQDGSVDTVVTFKNGGTINLLDVHDVSRCDLFEL